MKSLKMKITNTIFSVFFMILASGCNDKYDYPIPKSSFEETNLPPAAKITISKSSGSWKMFVNGEEFYIKGAAANNFHKRVADYGANTVRTYGVNTNSRQILDEAYAK